MKTTTKFEGAAVTETNGRKAYTWALVRTHADRSFVHVQRRKDEATAKAERDGFLTSSSWKDAIAKGCEFHAAELVDGNWVMR